MMLDDDMDDAEVTDVVTGCVGEGIAIKFAAHRKVAKASSTHRYPHR